MFNRKRLYRKFNKLFKYTTKQNVDPKVVFFNPKTKIFTIPKILKFNGEFGKKKPGEIKKIRQIIQQIFC